MDFDDRFKPIKGVPPTILGLVPQGTRAGLPTNEGGGWVPYGSQNGSVPHFRHTCPPPWYRCMQEELPAFVSPFVVPRNLEQIY